jgi:hypothetical protein
MERRRLHGEIPHGLEESMVIGAIIGDIVGSRFEFNNQRDKTFEMFTKDCKETDDSMMTLSIAKAIMEAM